MADENELESIASQEVSAASPASNVEDSAEQQQQSDTTQEESNLESDEKTEKKIIEKDVPPEFECNICLNILYEPVSMPCGHSYCKFCLKQALNFKQECPSCRAPCLAEAAGVATNVALQTFISQNYADLYEARKQECEAQRDSASGMGGPSSSSGSLGMAVVPEPSVTLRTIRMPIFFLDLMSFPGQPVSLFIFEPRYVLMINRILNGDRQFGIQPSTDPYCVGSVVLVSQVRPVGGMGPGGDQGTRYVVQAKSVGRYRINEAENLETEEGTGGLHYATVTTFDDDNPSMELEAELRERADTGWQRVQEACNALPTPHKRQLVARFGDPIEARTPQKLSFWLASCLRMPEDTRHRFFVTTNWVRRLRESLDILDTNLTRHGGTNDVFNLNGGSNQKQLLSTVGSSIVLLIAILIGLYFMRFSPGTGIPSSFQQYLPE
mmetsp:Transcript_935/g.1162  ORF Transcript_935/g.1162 Transcript_935/m.1162 type:complete len:438 (+) Transcript_935:47-1360(+)